MKLKISMCHTGNKSNGLRRPTATRNQLYGTSAQSGQALVEYLLLLMITVMIVMGALYQLSTGFQVFAKNYFGDYLECLLAAGELPGIGPDGGICSASYQPFSLSSGRPLVDSGNSGGGSTGGSSGSGSSDSNQPGGSGSDGLRGRSGSGGSRGANIPRIAPPGAGDPAASEAGRGDGGSGSGSRIGGGRRFNPTASKSASTSVGAGESIGLTAAETREAQGRSDIQAFKRLSGSAQDEAIGRLRFVPADRSSGEILSSTAGIDSVDSELASQRGRRVPGSLRGKSDAGGDDSEMTGLGLPDFLRYLLIAGILAVVLVFFGGQIAAFKKGSEKS